VERGQLKVGQVSCFRKKEGPMNCGGGLRWVMGINLPELGGKGGDSALGCFAFNGLGFGVFGVATGGADGTKADRCRRRGVQEQHLV